MNAASPWRKSGCTAAVGRCPTGWYRVRTQPVEGLERRAQWTITDITRERERHENSFQDLQRAMSSLEMLRSACFNSEADGAVSYMNATLARWLGNDIAEVGAGGLKVRDILSRDQAALFERISGKPGEVRTETLELDLKKRNGQVMAVRLLHGVSFGSDGSRGGTHTVVLDQSAAGPVSPENHAQAGARFARYFNNTPLAIVSVDKDGRIAGGMRCSPAFWARSASASPRAGNPCSTSLRKAIARSRGSHCRRCRRQGDLQPIDVFLTDRSRSARIYLFGRGPAGRRSGCGDRLPSRYDRTAQIAGAIRAEPEDERGGATRRRGST